MTDIKEFEETLNEIDRDPRRRLQITEKLKIKLLLEILRELRKKKKRFGIF